MPVVNFQGADLSSLNHVIEVEDVKCRCFPSKCCIRIQMIVAIKEKTKSFLRHFSGEKKEIGELKD